MNPDSLTAIVTALERDPVIDITGVFIVDGDAALMAKIDALGVAGELALVEFHQAFRFFKQCRAKSG
jgi:hypothetical protein